MYYGAYSEIPRRDATLSAQGRRKDLSKAYMSETRGGGGAGKLEKAIVRETEREFKRRGKFKRIFPSLEYNYYKQFFKEERPLNNLLDQKYSPIVYL